MGDMKLNLYNIVFIDTYDSCSFTLINSYYD